MIKRLFALGFAGAVSIAAAEPAAQTEFKGRVLGAPLDVEEVKADWKLRCDTHGYTTCSGITSIGGVTSKLLLNLKTDGSLARLSLDLPSAGFSEAITALEGKFGPPTKSKISEYRNGFGARRDGRSLVWAVADGGQILAFEVGGTLSRSSIYFLSSEEVERGRKAREGKATDV